MDYDAAKRVLAAFEREGVKYVVFGAAALNLHGLARFTEDLDLFILPERENINRLKREGTFHIDILTKLGDAFRFEDLQAVRVPFEELTVSVASPVTLYRMKRDTVRLKDKADAELLKQRFKLED